MTRRVTPTYTLINTVTLAAASSDIIFSSIPQNFSDLLIAANVQMASATNIGLQFNSDSASNYNNVNMGGNGSSTISGSGTHSGIFTRLDAASMDDNGILTWNIMDYSAPDKHKGAIGRNGTASIAAMAASGRWASSSPITSIRFYGTSANLDSGTTVSLYGIVA